jgi:hypothetical protein
MLPGVLTDPVVLGLAFIVIGIVIRVYMLVIQAEAVVVDGPLTTL